MSPLGRKYKSGRYNNWQNYWFPDFGLRVFWMNQKMPKNVSKWHFPIFKYAQPLIHYKYWWFASFEVYWNQYNLSHFFRGAGSLVVFGKHTYNKCNHKISKGWKTTVDMETLMEVKFRFNFSPLTFIKQAWIGGVG